MNRKKENHKNDKKRPPDIFSDGARMLNWYPTVKETLIRDYFESYRYGEKSKNR